VSAGHRVDAVFFDLFGTLLALDALEAACEAAAPGRGRALSTTWRARQLEISWLRTAMGAFVDFDRVTADALDAAMKEVGVKMAPAGRRQLARAFEDLTTTNGAPVVLDALRAAGLQTGVLTNCSRVTLPRVLARTRLDRSLDFALSVDAVAAFKPHPSVYRLATEATGMPAGRIGFVTANGWDAAGAAAFGLFVVWLRRGPADQLPPVGAPEPVIASWSSLPAVFLPADASPQDAARPGG
jgi:2-haloacid dehalogenase